MARFGFRHPFPGRHRHGQSRPCRGCTQPTLAEACPGRRVLLRGFAPTMPCERQARLLAYGLAPGRWVWVLQHEPVTVIRVDHNELALEDELARQIEVVLN